jgi:hypothetical protein
VVALALAACAQLALQRALTGTAGLVALTAPGLLAAASALIAIRLGAAAIRRRARVLTPSVPALLVTRSLARTPSALQRYVPVAVGVALLVFATQVAWLSVRNQRLHADAAVGAATVLRVELPPGADLRSVVRAADPGGTAAMAVRERAADNDGGTSRVVAVDAGRLAAVSAWRPAWAGLDGPRLAALLRPATEAPAEVRGSRLTVAVPVASIVPDPSTAAATDVPAAADLILVVAAGNAYGGPWQRIDLGPLGYRRRTLTADVPCAAGCRLVRLEIQKSAPTPFDADLTIDAMSTDQQPASHFAALLRDRRRWRPVLGVPEPGQPPQTTVRASTAGLHVTAVSFPGDTNPPAVAPADFPDPLPAVVARDAQAQAAPGYPGTVRGVGLDGQPLLLDVVAGAAVIPRALADGVLVDLGNAAALSDPAQEQVVSEVWLAPGADPAVRRRLTAAGVRVVGRETVSDSARHLAQATPGRAAVADLAVAGAALVLLLVVLTAGRVIDVGRRRTLWSVGRLSGLPRRRLARIAAIEISGPGAAATAIGVLAGLSSAALAGGRLPLFAEGTVGPPLDVRPAWTVAAAVAAGVAAAIGLVALGCAAVEAARAADAETR